MQLDLTDKLRGLMRGEKGVSIPSIVIIGNQSAGKTSVVERLSRVQLPRGSGTVTRCALVMRMKCVPNTEAYAVISGGTTKSKRIGLDEVEGEVSRITDELAPKSNGVTFSKEPIDLEITSPDVTRHRVLRAGQGWRDQHKGGRRHQEPLSAAHP